MPLQLKCKGCGHKLLVDEVFCGARCRCPACRHLVPVDGSPRVKRPAVRPDKPPHISATSQSSPLPACVQQAQRRRRAFFTHITVFRVMAAASVVLAVSVGATAWYLTATTRTSPRMHATVNTDFGGAANQRREETVEEPTPALAMLTTDPLHNYFGVALTGKTIGFVVDCDSTMSPYLDHVASLTNSVSAVLPVGTRFGVVQPSGKDTNQLSEIFEPSADLIGASTVLQSRLAGGATDLPKALARTESWYADQIFLVLAKPIAVEEVQQLTQHAQQTGSVTHVVAFGKAADQDLSPIAEATGGKFIPVTDELLKQLVDFQQRKQEQLANSI